MGLAPSKSSGRATDEHGCVDRGPFPWGPIAWGLSVMRAYMRIGWVRKSQFRWEFLNQVLMDLLFYVSFVLTFKILYGLGGSEGGALSLAGWSYGEVRVYLGMAFVADALVMTFLGQQWHFGADLKDGKLDSFRVRPGSTAFLYFFQRFSPEGLTNLAIAASWLGYSLASGFGSLGLGLDLLWTLPAALVVIAFSQVFLMIAYNSVELWLMHSDVGHMASLMLSNLGERPLEVYPRMLSRALKFVMPVAALAWYPASLVLGRLDPSFAAFYPLVLVAFAWVTARIFRRGLRNYESAMS